MTEVIKIKTRCVKCAAMVECEIPVFNMKVEYAAAIAAQMQKPGVVILCDDCTPKTEATT